MEETVKHTTPEEIAAVATSTPPLVVRPFMDLPLHKDDRGAVQMILREYLAHHMKAESVYRQPNPYPIDLEGLEMSLVTYCAMLRKKLATD
jgi:hypothetical protein